MKKKQNRQKPNFTDPVYKRKHVAYRPSDSIHSQMDRIVKKLGISFNVFLDNLVKEYIEKNN